MKFFGKNHLYACLMNLIINQLVIKTIDLEHDLK